MPPVHFHIKSQYTSGFSLITRKLLKIQLSAKHWSMGFLNSLSDGEVNKWPWPEFPRLNLLMNLFYEVFDLFYYFLKIWVNNRLFHCKEQTKIHLFCMLHKAVGQIVFKLWRKEISLGVHYHKKSIHIQFFAYISKTIKATIFCKALVNGFVACSFRWWSQIWHSPVSSGLNWISVNGEGGFDLLRVEISEIRSHHWMRLKKLG